MTDVIPGLVSTIVPVHNRGPMLIEAVESVLGQTYTHVEVIIADDGSTDDTASVIKALAARFPERVRYVLNPKRGAGPAREAGRQRAAGEFIQYLDSDDLLLPRKFEQQVAALRANPQCGAAYGYIRFRETNGIAQLQPFKRSGEQLDTLFPTLLVERWWNTDCPLFRRSVCDAVGPWTDLPYSQDWEYDGRVGALGVRLAHVPDFVCEQRHHTAPRQTGHGGWLTPPDRVRFFTSLLASARRASVPPGTDEMRMFSRWMFSQARECAVRDDAAAAQACLRLAVEAAGHTQLDVRVYRLLAGATSWRFAARVLTMVRTSAQQSRKAFMARGRAD